MERTPEETLKTLALMYCQKWTCAHLPAYKTNEVEVHHIKTKRDSHILFDEEQKPKRSPFGGLVRETTYEFIVRVSYLSTGEARWNGDNHLVEEIKWEGQAHEWFQACADVMRAASEKVVRE